MSDTLKFGAFADTNKRNIEPDIIIPDVPFSKLIISERPSHESSPPSTKEEEDCSKTILLEDQNGNSPSEKPKAAITLKPTNDDFIMVDLVNFFLLMGACLLTRVEGAIFFLLPMGEGNLSLRLFCKHMFLLLIGVCVCCAFMFDGIYQHLSLSDEARHLAPIFILLVLCKKSKRDTDCYVPFIRD